MAYRVDFTDQNKDPIIISDGSINTSTDLSLVGRNVSGYGEYIAENFVNLMENFASATPPPKPIEGQLWMNKANSSINVYTAVGEWKPISTSTVSITSPQTIGNEAPGDFWLDNTQKSLHVYIDNQWVEIATADPENSMVLRRRRDDNGQTHDTLEFIVGNKTILVMASDEIAWTPLSVGESAELLYEGTLMSNSFPSLRSGVNLNNTLGNLTSYNDISAVTASGEWLANDTEAVDDTIDNKLMTPRATNLSVNTVIDSRVNDFASTVPAGQVAYFAQITAPTGWLKANGAEISRVTYSDLYSVIGTLYGDGDGIDTFNLPDLRGEFIRGWDDSRGVDPGRALGSLQDESIADHRHNMISEGGEQYYAFTDLNDLPLTADAALGAFRGDGPDKSDDGKYYPYTGYVDSVEFDTLETRPRNIALLACIRYATALD